MIMFERRCKNLSTIVLVMLCCFVSAQAMESYERNQERLRAATFAFVEDYVNSINDQPRMYMKIPPCLLQYVPEKLTREFLPHHRCLINVATIDEIAAIIGVDAIIKDFTEEYPAFQKSNLARKRMSVSNYLYGAVFGEARESIKLKEKSRIDEESANEITRFLRIIT